MAQNNSFFDGTRLSVVPLLAGGGMFETGAGAIFLVCVCVYKSQRTFYHTDQPNVGKYTIHGSYGYVFVFFLCEGHKDAWAWLGGGLFAQKVINDGLVWYMLVDFSCVVVFYSWPMVIGKVEVLEDAHFIHKWLLDFVKLHISSSGFARCP